MTTIYLVVEETKFMNLNTKEVYHTEKRNWRAFTKEDEAERYMIKIFLYNNKHKIKGILRELKIEEIELD